VTRTNDIPIAGPWITDKEIAYAADAAATNWYDKANDYISRFEAAFATYVGRRHAIALPSCTSGLHLALAALGVGPGDEVIVPDITWIASAAPITYVGATPVFADIDETSWCVSLDTIKAVASPRTKAIVVVDLYGQMPDFEPILAWAAENNIAVVEDAAEAIGSTYKDQKAGSFGLASAFSFHGSKTLTTGEGGMLTTDDGGFYERCRFLMDHGRHPGDVTFRSTEVAFKYKMSAMQAALGLAQVERIDELVARKKDIFAWYAEDLAGVPDIALNAPLDHVDACPWMVTALFDGRTKEDVIARLGETGIRCRPYFSPLSSLDAYAGSDEAGAAQARNATAYRLAPGGVNLPSALTLTRENVKTVCAAVKQLLE
jgi:perosamine synthetase